MSSGTHLLNLAEETFQAVRRSIPQDQVPAWDELAKGQPLGVLVRLAKLWRVTLTDAARKEAS